MNGVRFSNSRMSEIKLPFKYCLSTFVAATAEVRNVKLAHTRAEAEDLWVTSARETQVLRMEHLEHGFNAVYEDFYNKHRKHRKFFLGTQWRCRWWVSLMYYFIMFFGAMSVFRGQLTVADLAGMVKLSAALSKYSLLVAKTLSSFQQASVSLSIVREVMDLDTESHQKMLQTSSGAALQEDRHDDLIDPTKFTAGEILWLALGLLFNPSWADRGVRRAKRLKRLMRKLSAQREAKAAASPGKQNFRQRSVDALTMTAKVSAAALTGVAESDEDEDEKNKDPDMFSGITAPQQWVTKSLSDPEAFHRIRLIDATLSADVGVQSVLKIGRWKKREAGEERARGKAEKILVNVLDDVSVDVPLGVFVSVAGRLPQLGRGVGRGVILELLCGKRDITAGEIRIPPQLNVVMLHGTYSILAIAARSLRDNLLLGCHNPKDIDDETVRAACHLAGLSPFFIDRLDYPCTLRGTNVREVDRVHVVVARAFLSGANVIGINRTDGLLSAAAREKLHAALRRWTEEGVPPRPLDDSMPTTTTLDQGDEGFTAVAAGEVSGGGGGAARSPNEVIAAANRTDVFPGAPARTVILTAADSDDNTSHAHFILDVGLGPQGVGAAIRKVS